MFNASTPMMAGPGSYAGNADQTIGEAGKQGFGVGVYGGEDADLDKMGLTPMNGCTDKTSPNYGNYQHTDGSVMCFIPAFAYRLGNAAAPSYSRDGDQALEIRDALSFDGFEPGATFKSADLGYGWTLHRAFVDGNVVQRGFFFDKYLCSNKGGKAVSTKGADWLMCYSGSTSYYTGSISGMVGQAYDAITLSRARGDNFSLVTCYQWAAMSILSLAHGQAAKSTDFCAWYDSAHKTNYPKGSTNPLKDTDDSSLTFTTHAYGSIFAKTGTCSHFAKSTHNGQECGIADVAGMCNQLVVGAINPSSAYLGLMKTSVKAHDFTKDNVVTSSLHDMFNGEGDGNRYFGGLSKGNSGLAWAKCGVIPSSNGSENPLFGNDEWHEYYGYANGLKCGLGYSWGGKSGVLCRSFRYCNRYGLHNRDGWNFSYVYSGFRAAGYAPF